MTISWRRRDDFTGIWLLPTGALGCEADREQIEATIELDPFVARGLADFRIVEFRASQRAPDLLKRIA